MHTLASPWGRSESPTSRPVAKSVSASQFLERLNLGIFSSEMETGSEKSDIPQKETRIRTFVDFFGLALSSKTFKDSFVMKWFFGPNRAHA